MKKGLNKKKVEKLFTDVNKKPSVFEEAISIFGQEHQLIKTIEELNEFSASISKFINYPTTHNLHAVAHEFCDINIMLAQMDYMLNDYLRKNKKLVKERLDHFNKVVKLHKPKNLQIKDASLYRYITEKVLKNLKKFGDL